MKTIIQNLTGAFLYGVALLGLTIAYQLHATATPDFGQDHSTPEAFEEPAHPVRAGSLADFQFFRADRP